MANNNRGQYSIWPKWVTKLHGPQPTEQQLAIAHAFGRAGKQSMGLAMALRDQGMTGTQMCGVSALFDDKATPCRNHILGNDKGVVTHGYFKREPLPHAIKVTLTAKGEAVVRGKAEAAKQLPKAKAAPSNGKAAKAAKPARKPRPAKAPAVEPQAPAVEAPAVEPQAEAPQS